MNVERWVRSRRQLWDELEKLLRKIERSGLSSLGRDELRNLGRLYRSASADLSRARALNIGGDTQVYLNNLVVKGHNQVYQRDGSRWAHIWEFFWITFPALVRKKIVFVIAAFLIFFVPMIGSYFLVLNDSDFAHMEVIKGMPLVPEATWQMIEKHKMWTDSVQDISPLASSEIVGNNIRVAILAFAYGITGGIGSVILLVVNGMSIGTTFGVCRSYGLFQNLLVFVAAHGVLEMTAIFISGGAGLLLGKALLFPGELTRVDALRVAARPALTMFCGCIPILLLAGTIEGFLSARTDLNAEVKVAISLITLICLLLYLFVPRQNRENKRIK